MLASMVAYFNLFLMLHAYNFIDVFFMLQLLNQNEVKSIFDIQRMNL